MITPEDASAEIELVEAALRRASQPVSDAAKERSRALCHAFQMAGDVEALGSRAYAHLSEEQARDGLRQAIVLDPHNLLAIALLLLEYVDEAAGIGALVMDVVKVSKQFKSAVMRGDVRDQNWSKGERDEREYHQALALLAILLDAAERYAAANRLRLAILKIDHRDGSGARFNVTAHALMNGDLTTCAKWLRWSVRESQVPRFWCWARVLHNRLTGTLAWQAALDEAIELEPLVPIYMHAGPNPPHYWSNRYMTVPSEDEQHFHAGILHRAWAAHPGEFYWMQQLALSLTPLVDALPPQSPLHDWKAKYGKSRK